MNKIEILKILAILSFIAILFSYQGSKAPFYLFFIGLIFGAIWFFKK